MCAHELCYFLLCNCNQGWHDKHDSVHRTRDTHVGDGAIALAGERVFVVPPTTYNLLSCISEAHVR
jgi:hypothetical protein